MVKLILPNSAPPGQESQKCLENSATDLVTSRLRERGNEVRPRGDEVRPRGDESSSFPRGDQVRGTIFGTFLALLARRSRVGQNEFHH